MKKGDKKMSQRRNPSSLDLVNSVGPRFLLGFLSLIVIFAGVGTGNAHCSGCRLSARGILPDFPVGSSPYNAQDATALAKDVVEKLAAEDFEGVTKGFNEELRRTLPSEKLEQGWTAVTQQYGSFESQGSPRTETREGMRGVQIRCRFERGAVNVEVWVDKDDLISGLWIRPAS